MFGGIALFYNDSFHVTWHPQYQSVLLLFVDPMPLLAKLFKLLVFLLSCIHQSLSRSHTGVFHHEMPLLNRLGTCNYSSRAFHCADWYNWLLNAVLEFYQGYIPVLHTGFLISMI